MRSCCTDGHVDEERLDDGDGHVVFALAQLAEPDASLEGGEGAACEDDLSRLRELLGARDAVDQAPREPVDQLDLGVADDEPASLADRDRHLEPELERRGRPGS